MKRSSTLLAFVFGLALASSCGDTSSADDSETGGECPVGAAGCPCTDGGSCDAGLECWMELCIPEGTAGDGDGDTNSTTNGDGDSTTNGDGDGDSTTNGDGDGDDESTTNGDGDGDDGSTTNGDGDGDTSGDGDGDTTGDGDGDGDEDVLEVVAGRFHTCARTGVGAVRCWGSGANGATGYASTADIGNDEPAGAAGEVDVGGPVIALAAGFTHTCAVLEGGAVRCWGDAGSGQLGYANTDTIGDDETPSSAGDVDLGGPAVAISAGDQYTCAVLEGGAVRCWGFGSLGRLGYANTTTIGDDETPASAGDVDLGGDAVAVTAGLSHTCALLDDGAVRCWGRGTDGRLGYGNTMNIGDDETPASAGDVDLGGDAQIVSAGVFHTCALLDGGGVRCWGNASFGKLGYVNANTIGDNEAPASAGDIELGGSAVDLDVGGTHTCAVLDGGSVRCWGAGANGRLGYSATQAIGDNESPADAGDVDVGALVTGIAGGYEHTCAWLQSGAVRCWGTAGGGRLGYGQIVNIGDNETPASAGDVPLF